MNCPLCKAEKVTEWVYEDDVVWCAYCQSHPDKVIIVLKRHTAYPTNEEMDYMKKLSVRLFPEKSFRWPASIRDHFHLHEA